MTNEELEAWCDKLNKDLGTLLDFHEKEQKRLESNLDESNPASVRKYIDKLTDSTTELETATARHFVEFTNLQERYKGSDERISMA